MSIQTSTGVKIYISTQLPATFDLAGYGALTWTEIKEVTNIVPPSPSYQVVTHDPLKTGITQKNKGFVDYGDPTIDYALDTSDTGQQMLQSAASGATKNLEHSFKLTYPNGDIRYFSGRVFSSLEGGFSANSMVSGTSNVGVSRAVVKIPAISFAANYVTNTYSILGEAKTFADAHTFTRSTTATFVGSNGLIQSAAIDAPRFTYDPVTLAPKGLLIEGSRTNLLTYSEQFDNAAWSKAGTATVTPNTDTAPDGTLTADTVHDVGGNSSDFIVRSTTVTVSSGGSVTISLFSKTATEFVAFGGATPAGVTTYQITATGAYYKHEITRVFATGGTITAQFLIGSATSPKASHAVWGAQLEVGSFASSYIPTTTAQVTRTADICTAKEFTSWYNQGEGSVFVDVSPKPSSGATIAIYDFTDLTSNNRSLLRSSVSGSYDVLSVVSGSSNFYTMGSEGDAKIAVAMTKSLNWNSSQDSVLYSGATRGLPNVNSLHIGSTFNSASYIYGTVAELNYYPTALSDEALQDLTR